MEIREIKLRIRFIVERDDESFHAFCPDLAGLHVGGDTVEDALKNAREAASLYLISLLQHDEPIPVGMVRGDHSYSLREFLWQYIRSKLKGQRASVEDVTLADDCLAPA
ncbi:MAG: type II toxin-antitoxin system HicB family antitoxin [Xanthomonadaceae bacterium]|nr:type II toxin-antitoxin system HicB family antitoxin [Xanthomonadaceae bacterium]MDE1961156.1 type II toxin-antitoxin system HicB family antitoxin [Xanthomonadaceae bacterium]MDE2084343.1 type II toxin-antitoxin system HicB family antitoxin [Xanthomonadaceae bacterium]